MCSAEQLRVSPSAHAEHAEARRRSNEPMARQPPVAVRVLLKVQVARPAHPALLSGFDQSLPAVETGRAVVNGAELLDGSTLLAKVVQGPAAHH